MSATVTVLPSPSLEDPMPTPRQKIPLGLAEIAVLLGVNEATPTRWKYLRARTRFPAPDGHVSRTVPFWWDTTIEAWARETGRWPGDEEAEARAAAAAAAAAARAEAEEQRARAAHARERALALQQEAADAEAAALEAERRAGGLPVAV